MKCKTEGCISNIVKIGKIYLKTDKTYIQRYKCKTCNKTFTNQHKLERQHKEKLYSSRKDVLELYCMGMSLRDLAKRLKISRNTVMSKLDLISIELESKFRNYEEFNFNSHKDNNQTKRPIVIFDEMETYEHTKLKPLSIVVAYDIVNKKLIDIQVATFFPKGRFVHELQRKPHLRIKYEIAKRQREDNRSEVIRKVLTNVKKYLDCNLNKPLFITDGKASYASILKDVFRDRSFTHEVVSSRLMVESYVKTSKYGLKNGRNKEKASFDIVCAVMRAKISRLRRDSFIHTKKVINLQKTLFLFMEYWNKNHPKSNLSEMFN